MSEIDIMKVSQDITDKIRLLEHGRDGLEPLAREKARTIANYDKVLRIAILKLKDSGKYPATLIEKLAKGECNKERGEMELADALLKIQIVKMNAVQAEQSGHQSVYRHLEVRAKLNQQT